jgi:hypothetical protein
LQRLSPDQLFVSYDTSGFPAGCTLQAWLDNGRAGRSPAFTVAHLIRLPKIASLATVVSAGPTDNAVPAGLHAYEITGDNLEMIGQLGWDQNIGVEVSGLPAAIPGKGQIEALVVNLPDPPSVGAPLYVWLRGETSSRATTVIPAPTAGAATRTASAPPLH